MLAKQEEPLITIEIAPGDVREEVCVKIGFGCSEEGDGALARETELEKQFHGIGPAAGRKICLTRNEWDVTGRCQTENERLFGRHKFLLFRFGGTFETSGNRAQYEAFEQNKMFDVFRDRPTIAGFAKVPLLRGETEGKYNETRVAGVEWIEDESAFRLVHGMTSIG